MKNGNIVRFKSFSGDRAWVALNVGLRDIARGLDTNETGIHLFGGMWYGNNPLNPKSYGKMIHPKYCEGIYVIGNVSKTPIDKIKILVS